MWYWQLERAAQAHVCANCISRRRASLIDAAGHLFCQKVGVNAGLEERVLHVLAANRAEDRVLGGGGGVEEGFDHLPEHVEELWQGETTMVMWKVMGGYGRR